MHAKNAILSAALWATAATFACTTSVSPPAPIAGVDASLAEADAGPPEICNTIDDDRDGRVDEDCSCTLDETQACWPGDPTQRKVGACRDGVQTCVGGAEFTQWGPCQGAVLPTTEIPDNDIDEDCSGAGCVPAAGGEQCDNGRDDDCDRLIDCEDTDDCWDSGKCTCTKRCPPGTTRWCDELEFCAWGTQICNPDGSWGECIESPTIPAGCSGPHYDKRCCEAQGLCCQNWPWFDSIGNCPPGELVCE